jgi:diguanylate cyclase (GGDEF)-like protein
MLERVRLNDSARMESLERYDVLDTSSEEAFDRITRLCCRIFGVPISTVTFLDGHRQWFKSRQGLEEGETSRNFAFCKVPVMERHPLVVPDSLEDPRFRENPLVLGPPFVRFYAGVPIYSAEGEPIGTVCAMDRQPRAFDAQQLDLLIDLAHLVETELELRLLATTDSLTGALSRRAFRQEGQRAIDLALRHRYDLSCLLIDLDHFKAINDASGHAAGDSVLRATIETCMRILRKSDLIGRVGGEEFAVILPHAGLAEAHSVAEKLREAIEKQAIGGPTALASVTASFGVTAMGRAACDVDALLGNADHALYEAKAAGRNRCVDWRPDEAELARLGRKVLKAGSIVFNRGGSSIDCTVRRLSDTGAKLDVISSEGVPPRFKLRIEADDFSRACEIVGKEDKHLEVAFC